MSKDSTYNEVLKKFKNLSTAQYDKIESMVNTGRSVKDIVKAVKAMA